jgi:hypothetical protein
MIAVAHFTSSADDFAGRGQDALTVLAARAGYLRGSLGRSTDDPRCWVLVTEWADVGSYRRALGAFDVKLRAAPLLGEAADLPSAFEELVQVAAGGAARVSSSDREPDA